jgi:hypothetical protein
LDADLLKLIIVLELHREHRRSARAPASPHDAEPSRHEVFQGTSLKTLVAMVAGGLGVTLLPGIAAESGIGGERGLVARPLATSARHARSPSAGARVRPRNYTVVDDVGRCINPLIVHAQTHGGIAQAVGEALWEECAIDPASGQPLAGSFMDYGLPRADALPSFTTNIVEALSPTNPFGINAGGEGGCTPALAVVVGAILDALAPLGVRDIAMPVTPFRIRQAIRDAQSATF